jgi:hypothetical protein
VKQRLHTALGIAQVQVKTEREQVEEELVDLRERRTKVHAAQMVRERRERERERGRWTEGKGEGRGRARGREGMRDR